MSTLISSRAALRRQHLLGSGGRSRRLIAARRRASVGPFRLASASSVTASRATCFASRICGTVGQGKTETASRAFSSGAAAAGRSLDYFLFSISGRSATICGGSGRAATCLAACTAAATSCDLTSRRGASSLSLSFVCRKIIGGYYYNEERGIGRGIGLLS